MFRPRRFQKFVREITWFSLMFARDRELRGQGLLFPFDGKNTAPVIRVSFPGGQRLKIDYENDLPVHSTGEFAPISFSVQET